LFISLTCLFLLLLVFLYISNVIILSFFDFHHLSFIFFFFFNDTATTEIYTLSLHDALPIYYLRDERDRADWRASPLRAKDHSRLDRKSTRLNSSHVAISYAVFCLKKKKDKQSSKGYINPTTSLSLHQRRNS